MEGKVASNEDHQNNAEQQKLSEMRSYVENHDASSKVVDDLMLRRFLRARNLDVEKAAMLFLRYLKWKREFMPKGCISESEIPYDIGHNKAFLGGVDKKGQIITVIFGSRHFQNPKPGGLDELKRYVVYCLEKLCARMPVGQEKFVTIVDWQGWGYSNSDIRGYIETFSILQEYYPERLGNLFMVHAPRVFQKVWKIVYRFIDNNTRSKIHFLEDKHMKSTLLEDIDETQLPDVYGGKLPLVSIQDA